MLLSLGGAWSCSVVACNDILEILENYTRTTTSSDVCCRVIQHEITSLARFNFDFMFALLHRSLKPSTRDLDETEQSYVFISSTALLLALLNETIIGTYGTMKGLDGVYTTKGISEKSTKSINNLRFADSFISEIENLGTTVSLKEVCLSFSSIMTAEFLTSCTSLAEPHPSGLPELVALDKIPLPTLSRDRKYSLCNSRHFKC